MFIGINITVPQFNGDAMLSLTRSHSGHQQRLSSAPTRPSYVAFNFSTSDPNGLILWINMVSFNMLSHLCREY